MLKSEEKQICKQCRKKGEDVEFESKRELGAHLREIHGLVLNKEAMRYAGLFAYFMEKPSLIYLRGREKPIRCRILQIDQYDLLVSTEHGDTLIPKHAIDFLTGED
jgi:hypothetical protein